MSAKHPTAGRWTRKALLAAWFIVLVPGGIGDLIVNPHRAATATALVVLGAVVLATSWRWLRALASVSLVLAALLIADDLFDGTGIWGTISLLADLGVAVSAIANLWAAGVARPWKAAALPRQP